MNQFRELLGRASDIAHQVRLDIPVGEEYLSERTLAILRENQPRRTSESAQIFFAEAAFSPIPPELCTVTARVVSRFLANNPHRFPAPRSVDFNYLSTPQESILGNKPLGLDQPFASTITRIIYGSEFSEQEALHLLWYGQAISMEKFQQEEAQKYHELDILYQEAAHNLHTRPELNEEFIREFGGKLGRYVLKRAFYVTDQDLALPIDKGLSPTLLPIERVLSSFGVWVGLLRSEADRVQAITASLEGSLIPVGVAQNNRKYLSTYFQDPKHIDYIKFIAENG